MRNPTTIILIVIYSCSNINPENQQSTKPSHKDWGTLLKTHVNDKGLVDYQGMIADSAMLSTYISNLTKNAPNSTWSTNEKLAYWINLYNACTVQLITKHYPLESIKDIGSSIQIPFVNTPWQIEFIGIDEKTYNLDDIEHNIIREQFNEPRIHFALVCAAISCPPLRREAYTSELLEEQLTNQARLFLADSSKNKISKDTIKISKIFKWYGGDFKKKNTLIGFLNQYCKVQINSNAKTAYMDYNWGLNSQ